jgi:beta-N-acetylhexosaminidase
MAKNNELTLRQKIASMLMFGFRGADVEDQGVLEIVDDIGKLGLGGVLLFGYNINFPEQLKNLTNLLLQADSRLLIAVDQEGGRVQRLSSKNGFKNFDTAKKIAASYSSEEAYSTYLNMAKTLKDYGINFNFAPCVDVDTAPPCSVIGGFERSFSDNPQTVINYSKQFIDAHKKHNIITALKHFPGHGFAQSDTHKGLTDTTDSANTDLELKPYKDLLSDSSNTAVMTAHIINRNLDESGYPATLSKKIITGILRENFNFQGVVVTDALEMGAIRNYYSLEDVVQRAINAGNDILVFARNSASSFDSKDDDSWKATPKKIIDIIEHVVLNGIISQSRIDESYLRIIKLKNLINFEDNCVDKNYFDNGDMCVKLQELE